MESTIEPEPRRKRKQHTLPTTSKLTVNPMQQQHKVEVQPNNSINNNSNAKKSQPSSPAFVASMTFATRNEMLPNCNCDECGPTAQSMIPETIRRAIQEHQQQSRRNCIRRTQHRALVQRASYGGSGDTSAAAAAAAATVAVWEWTLPVRAEPLLEFGNAAVDRFIWVKRLPQNRTLQTIGTGIVGSAHEEQTRENLEWHEGHVAWVPSNNGKAVGWICQQRQLEQNNNNSNNTKATAGLAGPAVLVIAKIPRPSLMTETPKGTNCKPEPKQNTFALAQQHQAEVASSPQWTQDMMKLYHQVVLQTKDSENTRNTCLDWTRLRSDMADQFTLIVTSLLPSGDNLNNSSS